MKKLAHKINWLLLLSCCMACNNDTTKTTASTTEQVKEPTKGIYSYDLAFLKKNGRHVIELKDGAGLSKVLLSPDYQGRVMTSTATGDSGNSFGWINYDLVASPTKKQHFNPVGGEERFWLGPEGGQYALYFKKGDSFAIANWWVPGVIDTEAYVVDHADSIEATFSKTAMLTNYAGINFTVTITRKIRLLGKNEIEQKLKTSIPSNINYVAFESDNQIRNTGNMDWKKEKGLLSIWLLGMMNPSDETKVIIPFNPLQNSRSYITDNYFGSIPADRLQVRDSILYFRCDGKSRGKIGISPLIAKPLAGSFDFKKNILTVIIPQVDKNGLYVNSKWEIQKQPYKGDVINSYNDGPLQDGSQLGPFYEVESSSSAKELKRGEVQEYKQTTCHFEADYKSLSELAKQLLGVDLDDLKKW